ncbi:ATPase [Pseudomonas brassicacearum]|uniref:ATPase n=1 Tax=Pseudomonas brassicacearum TaxID=930166 RepID=UPI001F23A107|nr:ATPase [Pseudomonas brassicacearum]
MSQSSLTHRLEQGMQKRIIQLLNKTSGLKAREIASRLGYDRKEVSQHLHEHRDIFVQDPDTFGWSVIDHASFAMELTCNGAWLSETHFEKAMAKSGSPLDAEHGHIHIKFAPERNILLCAAVKVLALANQLVAAKKRVELDFSENPKMLTYLDRAGFFDRLNSAVKVIPKRPANSAAQKYNGKNDGLVEFLEIHAKQNDVPDRIRHSFIEKAGAEHANKLFTVVAEFVGNVQDHSRTEIPGIAGLQCYGNGGNGKFKILAVVSDSGKGICATLRPGLRKYFPDIAKKFDTSVQNSDPMLILHAVLQGGLTRKGIGRGGIGLHAGHEMGLKLSAKIKIRQENFSVTLIYKNDAIERTSWAANLPKLNGTHITFEFNLDKKSISA